MSCSNILIFSTIYIINDNKTITIIVSKFLKFYTLFLNLVYSFRILGKYSNKKKEKNVE